MVRGVLGVIGIDNPMGMPFLREYWLLPLDSLRVITWLGGWEVCLRVAANVATLYLTSYLSYTPTRTLVARVSELHDSKNTLPLHI